MIGVSDSHRGVSVAFFGAPQGTAVAVGARELVTPPGIDDSSDRKSMLGIAAPAASSLSAATELGDCTGAIVSVFQEGNHDVHQDMSKCVPPVG